MAILINALNSAPLAPLESDPWFALPKEHLLWRSGVVSYDIITFRAPATHAFYFQLRNNSASTLDANLKYATPTHTYGSYEYFRDTYYIKNGWFLKDRTVIFDDFNGRVATQGQRISFLDKQELSIELDNQGYTIPATFSPLPISTDSPFVFAYDYLSFRIRLNLGAEIRLMAVTT